MQWQLGKVKAIIQETPRVKTFTFELPVWKPHLPGQHYDLRLTAPDGYQAQRSYSIASPPEQIGEIDLTIEWIEAGEVSSYLYEAVETGDLLELRGPIGNYFVWEAGRSTQPVFLIGGGSGVVPLMSMLRHYREKNAANQFILLYSARTEEDVIYKKELNDLHTAYHRFELICTFTRQKPTNWQGYTRRIDFDMLKEIINRLESLPLCYVCGPTSLVENAANILLDIGIPTADIRTERFGPLGT